MARDDWRIRIEIEDEEAPGLLERLGLALSDEASELAQELEKRRLAVSYDDDEVFVYASSRAEAERARAVIQAELRDLGVAAVTGPVEHWLEDEERWDDEPPDETWEEDELERGYAPWEVRISCESHRAARELAEQLEQGYRERAPFEVWQHERRAAYMQEATQPTILSEAADPIAAASYRAEAWAGEPFLHEGEDPAQALAAGTARRRALDDALAEIDAGRQRPSPQWKVRYALMLGLERVLADPEPHTATGTPLRRHQIDALAGMLTELISAAQRQEENGNGNGHAVVEEVVDEEDDDEPLTDVEDEEDEEPELTPEQDPGAVRRYRFRHPTASGKTIAAAGFVDAARTLGVLILTHRRLLVTQFTTDLTTEGYGERFHPAIDAGKEPLRTNPLTIQTYAWFARHVDTLSRDAYQLVICDEAHTALGEKTSAAIRSFPEPVSIGMTATEQLIAKQVSDVFPASVDDLP